MPYKSEKIIIENGIYDKRIKLTSEDKEKIIQLHSHEGQSQRALAKAFGVSRRLISFILFPERHEENLKRREERGGSAAYYTKEKQREYIKTHRKYKQQLKIEGKIKGE